MYIAQAARPLLSPIAALAMLLFTTHAALAVPSYARQTGQDCAACHNGFPELTPYGRLFKLNGYTFGGGQSDVPPLAAIAILSDTHTQAGQPGGAAPHNGPNNNFSFDSASIFYSGALTPNIGTFAQVTYDHVGRNFTWDNLDIRYAGTTRLFDRDAVLGVTINNNPTVTDVWNTTPAWIFPNVVSELAPVPAAATLIEGGLAQQVIGSSAYGYFDRLFYAEFGAFSTLTKGIDSGLGVNPEGTSAIKGLAPYWRLAVEPQWGPNSLEFGVFGLAATLNPGRVTGFGTDHTVDVGVDSQYQYLLYTDSVSLDTSFITENQSLTASQAIGNSTNSRDHLRSFHTKVTYAYDQTYYPSIGYFQIQGSGDALQFGADSASNSPNSRGYLAEFDYYPFNHGGPDFYTYLNIKLGLQYILYEEFNGGSSNFDGAGRNARDNNTLFTFVEFAF